MVAHPEGPVRGEPLKSPFGHGRPKALRCSRAGPIGRAAVQV